MLKYLWDSHYVGLRHWMLQRFTALVMAIYSMVLAAMLLAFGAASFDAWRGMFVFAWFKAATLAFLWCLMAHAWLGVRDIIKDYVPIPWVKIALQRLLVASLFVYAGWSAIILWSFK